MFPTMDNVLKAERERTKVPAGISPTESKKGLLQVKDIVDINMDITKNETTQDTIRFTKMINDRAHAFEKAGLKADYYLILRNSLVQLYFPDIFFCFIMTLFSECLAVFYSYQIKDLIGFIKLEEISDDHTSKGIRLVSIFIGSMLVS